VDPNLSEIPEGGTLHRLNQELVQRAMNVLTEAPYFYLEDDRALFQYLRRNRNAFRDFVKYYFGWDLIVDARCARLIKRGDRENPELKGAHVDTFHLPRRNLALVFLILLEFFEIECRRVNWQYERDAYLRFFHNDYFEHAKARFRALLGERAPEDGVLRRDIQETWTVLIKYRFIRPIPPTPAELLVMDRKQGELYEFLPAVLCYDSNVLRDADWLERLKTQPEEAPGPV
jgi:hypothetical protein